MKILSAAQLREADAYTIVNKPIDSLQLMEQAAGRFTKALLQLFPHTHAFTIVAGTGNNGGDGMVCARLLLDAGKQVQTIVVAGQKQTIDFSTNTNKLREQTEVNWVEKEKQWPELEGEVIVDALFGTGLNKPIDGLAAFAIDKVNQSKKVVVALDMPSGLYADKHTSKKHPVVKAKHTLSFQYPKLAFMMPENAAAVGEWQVLDIGLLPAYADKAKGEAETLTFESIRKLILPRKKFSHKGTFGHALIVGGSYGKTGAVVLSARSCMRSGVGLTSLYVPACSVNILQTAVPEAMCIPSETERKLAEPVATGHFAAIGMGPGLGTNEKTGKMLLSMIDKAVCPVVLDADALNLLAMEPKWKKSVKKNSVLTPHPKEFERLVGKSANDFEVMHKLRELSATHDWVVLVKGAHTCICDQKGKLYFNTTGNHGMASGGMGDVLTGMITGLMAQGYSPLNATKVSVFLHGLAGDLAAEKTSAHALTASDLTEHIGKAWLKIVQD
jgi:hydroxyethylthiazole kinase-like uncharacterized protein yjeF